MTCNWHIPAIELIFYLCYYVIAYSFLYRTQGGAFFIFMALHIQYVQNTYKFLYALCTYSTLKA